MVPKSTPMVVINRENPGVDRNKTLVLEGEIEDTVAGILRDLGWVDMLPEEVREKAKPKL